MNSISIEKHAKPHKTNEGRVSYLINRKLTLYLQLHRRTCLLTNSPFIWSLFDVLCSFPIGFSRYHLRLSFPIGCFWKSTYTIVSGRRVVDIKGRFVGRNTQLVISISKVNSSVFYWSWSVYQISNNHNEDLVDHFDPFRPGGCHGSRWKRFNKPRRKWVKK